MITIPESYINGLNMIPKNTPIAVIMRHAERFDIKRGEVGLEVPLTKDGEKSAFKLGSEYLKGKISSIYSSYVERCIHTGENILKGVGNINIKIEPLAILAGDEIFINDFMKMSDFYMTNGMLALLDLAYDRKKIVGLNNVEASVYKFINIVLEKIENQNAINLFITHDMFISLIAGEIFRHKTTGENWPDFMEPIFIWKEGSDIKLFFRNYFKVISTSCLSI